MFIGHLPVGYLVSRHLAPKLTTANLEQRYLVVAGMLGAITPDFDMFYFYLIDNRQHHHHLYFPHLPVVWALLLSISVALLLLVRKNAVPLLAFIFALNGMIHMVLDSIAGYIWWLAPWVNQPFSLVTVQARYQPWWLNFLLHWTFLLEVFVLLLAVVVWHRGHRGKKRHAAQQLNGADSSNRHLPCKEKSKARAYLLCSSSWALGGTGDVCECFRGYQ